MKSVPKMSTTEDAPQTIENKAEEKGTWVSTPIFPRGNNRNKSRCVLEVRLAQEKPEYSEAYYRGDYKSVTAAAIAAGLIPNDGNMRRAKSAIRRMPPEQRKELDRWMKTESFKEC